MGVFAMPSLGADMAAGTLVEWLKHPGDAIARGDIIAVVETDKGAIEVEVFEDGRIDKLLVPVGSKVPVGTPLATIAGTGAEDVTPPTPEVRAPEPLPVPPPVFPSQAAPPPPALAMRVSPAARKAAEARGIDPRGLTGTGPGGAITLADIPAAVPKAAPPHRGIDLDQMRHAIAAAMARSKSEIPHYYLAHSFDVEPAVDWLGAYNGERDPADRLLFGALLMKAVAVVVRDYPEFNGHHAEGGFRASPAVHVGMAIAIRGGGLAAPAIHDTDKLSLAELMRRMQDLVARVRKGQFRASELSDATITVSSLGDRGVDALFPIIYPPQVAIIGFGASTRRPWAVDGQVQIRPVIAASLAADHRVSDGHRGALFLKAIVARLQTPETL